MEVELDPRLGHTLVTDSKRLQQVLKNLLSNAFKFTEHGGVRLNVLAAPSGWSSAHPILAHAPAVVAFEVSDTGIGIPPEKQRIIFKAFQQADASTSRKYGGPGLGLAISRELANLLGGEIHLRSTPGIGSIFTLYLPLTLPAASALKATPVDRTTEPSPAVALPVPRSADRAVDVDRTTEPSPAVALPVPRSAERAVDTIPDDRLNLQPGDPTLLIVEDDPHYARLLVDLAHDKGFKVLLAMRGADALALAREHNPDAVSLDVFLPDMLGWTVLSELKRDPLTRHIPVQIVTVEDDRQHGFACGAFSFVTKPVTKEDLDSALYRIKSFARSRRKRLLVVEDNAAEQLGITELAWT